LGYPLLDIKIYPEKIPPFPSSFHIFSSFSFVYLLNFILSLQQSWHFEPFSHSVGNSKESRSLKNSFKRTPSKEHIYYRKNKIPAPFLSSKRPFFLRNLTIHTPSYGHLNKL
jgi:hypothetical protein